MYYLNIREVESSKNIQLGRVISLFDITKYKMALISLNKYTTANFEVNGSQKVNELLYQTIVDLQEAYYEMVIENVENKLSIKEIDIIKLVVAGKNNKEIGEVLGLGEGTIKNYISSILAKLALKDRTQLAVCALTNRIIGYSQD